MATPQMSRKRPFSAVGGGDGPVVCSPQTRRSTTLSSVSDSLHQSPLPEVRNEEDIREKKEKRRSRNFTAATGSPFARSSDDNGEAGKLTNDQLASHYVNCIKLSTENKITAKNAFSLHLIDHMNEMLKQRCEGVLNFQMAGGTIFASAKIYASRVDAVHSETYKVMSSLGRGSNEEKSNADDATGAADDDGDERKQTGKKRKKRSKILENNPSSLRLKQLEVSYQADPLDQYYSSVFDVANTSGLLINHLTLCKDGLTVQYHSDVKSRELKMNNSLNQDGDREKNAEQDEKQKREQQQAIEDRFLDLTNLHDALKKACICQTTNDFSWDQIDDSQDNIGESDKALSSQEIPDGDGSQSEANMDDDDDMIGDNVPPDHDDVTFTAYIQGTQSDKQDNPLGMDEQLVTALEPGEYSYFKSGAISTWDGPNHWKMKLPGKPPSAATAENADSGQPNKGRKKKKKFYINYRSQNYQVDEEAFQRSKKSIIMTRRMTEKWKSTKNSRLLPAAGEDTLQDLEKCNLQPGVNIRPVMMMKKKGDDVDDDTEQLGTYNYDNPNDKNNYCPNLSDDEDGFDPGDGIPANFATDYSAAECTTGNFPDVTMSQTQSQAQADIDAILKGDHLISHPRKIEKISIAYAKKATRIDVRRLKAAMWSALQHNSAEPEATAEPSSTEPDIFDPPGDGTTFSDLYYSGIQGLMPQSMTENLSIPLAFTCLLHLANEKSLHISGDSEMSDLLIGISESAPEQT